MTTDHERQQALSELGKAMDRAQTCGAITRTEWMALAMVPVGQGDAAAQLAVEALASTPEPTDSSPDPEGAVAREVAPDSDTARETE